MQRISSSGVWHRAQAFIQSKESCARDPLITLERWRESDSTRIRRDAVHRREPKGGYVKASAEAFAVM
jgi:hypothetical protein